MMKKWIKDTAIRTIKTAAQAALGVIGTTAVIGDVDWITVGGTVAVAAVTCVLMNIANIPVEGGDAQ